jgi:putative transposase
MVQADQASLSIVRQCALLSISRSGFYYEPVGDDAATLALMQAIDEAYLQFPFYGSRQMARHLFRQGPQVGRKRVRWRMARMGLTALYQKPRTSAAARQSRWESPSIRVRNPAAPAHRV